MVNASEESIDKLKKSHKEILGKATFAIIDELIARACSKREPFKKSIWENACRHKWPDGEIAFKIITTYTYFFGITSERGSQSYSNYKNGRRIIQHYHIEQMHKILGGFGFKSLPALPPADDIAARVVWVEAVRDQLCPPREPVGAEPVDCPPGPGESASAVHAFPSLGKVFGRDEIVAELTAAILAQRPSPLLILGGPGMGKTTVGIAIGEAEAVIAKFGDRRWFVPLDDARSDDALRDRIAVRLGLDRTAPPGSIVAALDSAPALLVLDNFETPWEPPDACAATEELLGVIAQARHLALIVTMRGEVAPGELVWRRESLRKLSDEAGERLFLDQAGTISPRDPHLPRFIHALGGIPLALRLVARRVGGRSDLASLWDEWKAAGVELARQIGSHPGRLNSLPISIALSLASPHLTEAGRTTFSLLGRLPSGLAWQDRRALLGERGHDGYDELLSLGLAIERDGRLDLLPPIRDFSARYCTIKEEINIRWIKYFTSIVNDVPHIRDSQIARNQNLRAFREAANANAAFEAAAEEFPEIAAHSLLRFSIVYGLMDVFVNLHRCSISFFELSADMQIKISKSPIFVELMKICFHERLLIYLGMVSDKVDDMVFSDLFVPLIKEVLEDSGW